MLATPRKGPVSSAVLGHSLVVVADAHLGASPPAVEQGLLAFLEAVPSLGDCLLINGDLFEFWFGYARVIPRQGFHVAAAIARLAQRVPVVMVGGNHDRWDGGFWRKDVKIEFAPLRARFVLGGRRVLALHGDGLTERSSAANLLHRVVNHRLTAAVYGAIHPDLGIRLVQRVAPYLGDQSIGEEAAAASGGRQRGWAERALRANPEIELLVMAHTHHPDASEPSPGRHYLNPGAWMDGYRYAIATGRNVELRRFRAE